MASVSAKYLIQSADSIEDVTSALETAPISIGSLRDVDIRNQYFDTRKWALAELGWVYSWRSIAGERWICLDSLLPQTETHTHPALEQRVEVFPTDPSVVPAGIIRQAVADIENKSLYPLFDVHSQHRKLSIELSGSELKLSIATTVIRKPAANSKSKHAPVRFTELQLDGCGELSSAVSELVGRLETRFSLLPSKLTNFERGLVFVQKPWPRRLALLCHTAKNSTFGSASCDSLSPPRIPKKAPAWKLVQLYLRRNLVDLRLAEPRAWEGLDPEGVHQMRVATRRMRATIRAFRRPLPGLPLSDLNTELKWLAARLGAVRDLDVYLDGLAVLTSDIAPQAKSGLCEYRRHLTHERQRARSALLECLSDARYTRLESELSRVLQHELSGYLERPAQKLSISDAAGGLIRRQYKRVLRQGRMISRRSPSEKLHQLRIECKRLRYLFEMFRPTFEKAIPKYIQRLKRLQELLGDYQDACVASCRLLSFSQGVSLEQDNRELLLTCGHLLQNVHLVAEHRRRCFAAEWRKFDRPGKLERLLAKLKK